MTERKIWLRIAALTLGLTAAVSGAAAQQSASEPPWPDDVLKAVEGQFRRELQSDRVELVEIRDGEIFLVGPSTISYFQGMPAGTRVASFGDLVRSDGNLRIYQSTCYYARTRPGECLIGFSLSRPENTGGAGWRYHMRFHGYGYNYFGSGGAGS